MIDIEKVANRVFQLLTAFGYTIKSYDKVGKPALDPTTEGRKFYCVEDGIMVSLDAGLTTELNIYFPNDLNLDTVRPLLNQLRTTANFYSIDMSVKKFNGHLEPKDFSVLAYRAGKLAESDVGKPYGTNSTSLQNVGKMARVRVKHDRTINPDVHGSRSRNIKAIFIEDDIGQRLHFPVNNLHGARAMARHVSSGGCLTDEMGTAILTLSKELVDLRQFLCYLGRFTDDTNEAISDVCECVRERISHLTKILKSMVGPRGYKHHRDAPPVSSALDIDEPTVLDWSGRLSLTDQDAEWTTLPVVLSLLKTRRDEDDVRLTGDLTTFSTSDTLASDIAAVAGVVDDTVLKGHLLSLVDRLEDGDVLNDDEVSLVQRLIALVQSARRDSLPLMQSTLEEFNQWVDSVDSLLEQDSDEDLKDELTSNPVVKTKFRKNPKKFLRR